MNFKIKWFHGNALIVLKNVTSSVEGKEAVKYIVVAELLNFTYIELHVNLAIQPFALSVNF